MLDLIKTVRTHVANNYGSDGWDYVVECFDDDELAEEISKAGAKTEGEASTATRHLMVGPILSGMGMWVRLPSYSL